MAQTGFTPILVYASGTATNVPLAANLTSSASGAELALNYADGKLYFKNSSGVVTLLASSATVAPVTTFSAGTTGFTPSTATSGAVTLAGTLATTNGGTGLTSFTANRVFYSSSTSAIGQSANLTFDGTTLTAANFADSSLTSGRVTYATTSGNLTDSANLTFDGTTLTANALTTTSTVTINGGTANGVAYLNGSKVLTTGSALTFNGTNFGVGGTALEKFAVVGTTSSLNINPDSSGTAVMYAYMNSAYNPLRLDGLNQQFYISGAEQMRLTSTGLGIGTSSPGYKLDVNGGVRAIVANGTAAFLQSNASGSYTSLSLGRTSQEIFISVAGVANNFITGSAAGDLTINNNTGNVLITAGGSATQLYLNTSGNLGLGVTPSAWSSLAGGAFQNGGNGALWSQGTDEFWMTQNVYFNGLYRYTQTRAATAYQQSNGQHRWWIAPSGTAGNAISFTQAMTLDASGNLGVGTTTIGSRVTIGDPGTGLGFTNAASGNFNLGLLAGTGSADAYVYQRANNPLIFGTNNTERARITSGGFFKASDAGTYIGSTGAYHELVSSTGSATAAVYIRNTNATSPAGIDLSYSAASPNGTGNTFLYCQDSTALRMSIRSNGGIANFSANNVNLSDRREKTNFAPAKSYLDTICAIPVQTFNYIDQSEDDPGLTLGVIAQDVQAVAPELVMESNWGTEDNPKMRLSIYQTDLQYALMKALQELKSELDSVKAELATLKGA